MCEIEVSASVSDRSGAACTYINTQTKTQTRACTNVTHVGEDAAARDGDAAEQLVELLVVADGELQVARDDADLLCSFCVCGGVVWVGVLASASQSDRAIHRHHLTHDTNTSNQPSVRRAIPAHKHPQPTDLVVAGGVAGELEDLGAEILEHRRQVHGRALAHALRVAACGFVCLRVCVGCVGGEMVAYKRTRHTNTQRQHTKNHARTLAEVALDAGGGECDAGLGGLGDLLAAGAAAPACLVWLVCVGVCGGGVRRAQTIKHQNTNTPNTRYAPVPLAPALHALVALLPVPDMVLVGWWLEVLLPVGWVEGGVVSCGVRRKQ